MAVEVDGIRVEVAYATPDRQLILGLETEAGITVEEAIRTSGILDAFPDIEMDVAKVGIFGKAATMQTTLVDGDRVEIYRPLIADPKEARRKRAAEGKTLKNRASRNQSGEAEGSDEN